MTSGTPTSHLIVGMVLIELLGGLNVFAGATQERIDAIVRGIDTPRDTPIPFVEQRTNRLLKEPLQLLGEMRFSNDGELSKRIGDPFDESVTISPKMVSWQRAGKTRRVALDRRPDIKAFYTGMQALLAGDASALADTFDVIATENAAGWQLELAPKDERLRDFVARLVISGAGGQVLNVRTEQPGGDWQEMSFHSATD